MKASVSSPQSSREQQLLLRGQALSSGEFLTVNLEKTVYFLALPYQGGFLRSETRKTRQWEFIASQWRSHSSLAGSSLKSLTRVVLKLCSVHFYNSSQASSSTAVLSGDFPVTVSQGCHLAVTIVECSSIAILFVLKCSSESLLCLVVVSCVYQELIEV